MDDLPPFGDPDVARALNRELGVGELYRLRGDLAEVSLYVSVFRAPHTDTADMRVAWDGLRHSLRALSALPS